MNLFYIYHGSNNTFYINTNLIDIKVKILFYLFYIQA